MGVERTIEKKNVYFLRLVIISFPHIMFSIFLLCLNKHRNLEEIGTRSTPIPGMKTQWLVILNKGLNQWAWRIRFFLFLCLLRKK